MPDSRKQRYRLLLKDLKNERSSFEGSWGELRDNFKPQRVRLSLSEGNRGDRRNRKILDSSPVYAARTLASGMHSGMTSPARPWFRLTTPDPELAEFGPVKDWLHQTTQRMASVFLRSNIYNKLPILYGDMGVFGTGALSVMESDRSTIRCFDFPVGSYWIANDTEQRVAVFAREFRMTVRQLVQRFGQIGPNGQPDWSIFSPHVHSAWDRGNYEQWVDVVHIVQPNPQADPTKLHSKFKPFLSCYFEMTSDDERFLEEKGFDEFPVLAGRWEVSGEDVYGTEYPGVIALGDVKELYLMKKRGAQALDKSVNPPMVASPGMRSAKLSILPGEVSYVQEAQHQTFRPAHEVRINFAELRTEREEVRQLIRRAFYEDLFLMLEMGAASDRRQITATEILERREEKLLALGPVLEQLNQDVLGPLIDRTFAIMERGGQIPPPPPDLQGVALRVEYLSIMAQAQKSLGRAGIREFAGFVGELAAVNPSVLDKVDFDQMVDEFGERTDVPPRIIVPDEQVAEIRQARAQAAQAQQAAEMAAKVAPAAKQLSETDTRGENALTDLLGAGVPGGVTGGAI